MNQSPSKRDGQLPSDEQKETEKLANNEHISLKTQLEQMFAPFDKSGLGRIASQDLFKIIETFESEQKTILLKDEDRSSLQLFCEQNPDMEVSVDDVLQLVTKLKTPQLNVTASPSPSSNVSEPPKKIKFGGSLRPNPHRSRTHKNTESLYNTETDREESYGSSSISTTARSNRRMSSNYYDSHSGVLGSSFSKPHYDTSDDHEMSFEGSGGFDEVSSLLPQTTDDPAVQLSRLYRHTVDLTKRLKESERHLASVARQHEDRIEELQHKLEETKADLVAKKREIQDHKNKEKTNIHQITALEGEVQRIGKDLSGQMQLYHQLKRQYEEQREEAEKLKDLVKIKEEELHNTQRNLNYMSSEEKKWLDNRERLEHALSKLEQDLASAQASEIALEEQRNENMHLKETIDKLKLDLEEIRTGRAKSEFDVVDEVGSGKNLLGELADTALASISEEQQGSDSNTDDLRRSNKELRLHNKTNDVEPSYSQHGGEVEKSRGADDHARRSNSQRSVRRQITDSGNVSRNSTGSRDVESQYQILSSELGVQYALIEGILRNRDLPSPHDRRDRQIRNSLDGDSADLRRLSRQSSSRKNRRKANHVAEIEPPSERADTQNNQSSRALVTRNSDMNVAQRNAMVNNTVTIALYTLVIYFFGIITSVFVLDNNQGPAYSDWLPYEVVKDDSWTARSMEIILYWVENLLNDGNMRVPT
ncbi:annexin family protein [Gigaspora margarita]|uniref:Annexin family protein n=1 Tax=Gigaspora margarita TaxID=4874 RepID=A0A8H3WWN9_GIGMA|nr:annexin family protein [Gigaspora margarita]